MAARLSPTFSRRSLLGVLSGALGMAASAVVVRPAAGRERPLALLDTYVAGTAYYEARRVAGDLRPGEALVLCREPANPYDDLAIEVFTAAGAKLGYVPRADNEPFARLMDAGKQVEAEVAAIDPGRWRDIAMTLKLHIA